MKGGYSKVNRTPSYRGSNHLNDFNDFTKKMRQNKFTPNDRKEVKKKGKIKANKKYNCPPLYAIKEKSHYKKYKKKCL